MTGASEAEVIARLKRYKCLDRGGVTLTEP
jgi:hypothetical protein